LRLIRWAKETYPIDPRRVFIFGSSNGAAYVGRFGSAHQELIAGVVGYCGSYKFDPELKNRPAATRNEWYFVHGGKDRPQNSRRACDELKALGYRYVFRQMDGYGHTDIWDSIGHPDNTKAEAVRQDWLLWLHALRHKEIAPSADEGGLLSAAAAGLAQGKGEPGDLKEVARIGGEPAGKIIVPALASSDSSIRAAAARTMERSLYGPTVVAKLIPLLRDGSEEVRAAALRGLASAANWRNAEAQVALSRLARAADAPAADRLRVIAALANAAQLALQGNVEDGLLIWTPVLLLDDDNPQIRAAAFAVLEKSVPDTFGYKPDLSSQERKASVEKWKQWCQEKCGPAPALPQ
jgi:hypothetical protein